MKYGPDDSFWYVTDPGDESEMGDILFETSLRGLELQFKGGLTIDSHPTIFSTKAEAEIEAYGRMVSPRAAREAGKKIGPDTAERLGILDAEGKVVFAADLRGCRG
jgi:hypothetical protein